MAFIHTLSTAAASATRLHWPDFRILMQTKWSNLKALDIGSNKLSDTNVHRFEQFCWSALEEIDVSRAGLAGQSLCRLCFHVRPYIRKARFKGSTLLGPCLAGECKNLEVLDVRHL